MYGVREPARGDVCVCVCVCVDVGGGGGGVLHEELLLGLLSGLSSVTRRGDR